MESGPLLKQRAAGLSRVRIGLRMLEPGIPREENALFKEGEEIGFVTSGTFSPLLRVGIGMGYAKPG